MVARLLEACGVTPSGIMTSHMTSTPLVRAASGYTATGFSTQSELRPSACIVEEPSKPQSGSCSSVGNEANSLICVLPRRFGTGVYPSSQMYSSLYLVIEISHELMTPIGWNTENAFGLSHCTQTAPTPFRHLLFMLPNDAKLPVLI